MADNKDLLEHAKRTEDFYALLGVAFETSESDIRRAYRKTALKYHPDKLGADFDPEKFHLLQIAYDVLSDPAAKAVYDQGRQAKIQKAKQNALFEGKRRAMKEELEARERSGGTAFGGNANGAKRERDEDEDAVNLRKIMEAGKRRRLAEEEKQRAAGLHTPSKPIPVAVPVPEPVSVPSPQKPQVETKVQTAAEEQAEEDEIARLERRIKEAEEAKARRKAQKKARKSGINLSADDSPAPPRTSSTPLKNTSFASSPHVTPLPQKKDTGGFEATLARLREAERKKLEEQIRMEEENGA